MVIGGRVRSVVRVMVRRRVHPHKTRLSGPLAQVCSSASLNALVLRTHKGLCSKGHAQDSLGCGIMDMSAAVWSGAFSSRVGS
jgi:hypothetical protein